MKEQFQIAYILSCTAHTHVYIYVEREKLKEKEIVIAASGWKIFGYEGEKKHACRRRGKFKILKVTNSWSLQLNNQYSTSFSIFTRCHVTFMQISF